MRSSLRHYEARVSRSPERSEGDEAISSGQEEGRFANRPYNAWLTMTTALYTK